MRYIIALFVWLFLVGTCPAWVLVVHQADSGGGQPPSSVTVPMGDTADYTDIGAGVSITAGVATGVTNWATSNIVYNSTTTSADDHYVEGMFSAALPGLVLRCNSVAETGYNARHNNATTITLYSFDGTTQVNTSKAWTGLTLNSATLVRIEVTGDTFELFLDTVSQGTVTDSTYALGQHAGMSFDRASGENPEITLWEAGTL